MKRLKTMTIYLTPFEWHWARIDRTIIFTTIFAGPICVAWENP
jgi:hypothetical protein